MGRSDFIGATEHLLEPADAVLKSRHQRGGHRLERCIQLLHETSHAAKLRLKIGSCVELMLRIGFGGLMTYSYKVMHQLMTYSYKVMHQLMTYEGLWHLVATGG